MLCGLFYTRIDLACALGFRRRQSRTTSKSTSKNMKSLKGLIGSPKNFLHTVHFGQDDVRNLIVRVSAFPFPGLSLRILHLMCCWRKKHQPNSGTKSCWSRPSLQVLLPTSLSHLRLDTTCFELIMWKNTDITHAERCIGSGDHGPRPFDTKDQAEVCTCIPTIRTWTTPRPEIGDGSRVISHCRERRGSSEAGWPKRQTIASDWRRMYPKLTLGRCWRSLMNWVLIFPLSLVLSLVE